MPDPDSSRGQEDDGDRRRGNLLFLLVAVLVVVAGIWLVNKLIDLRNLQNCLESGRHNCAPIETSR